MNGTDIELRFEAPFPAPLGVVETDELRWYLEVYPGWPLGVFRERAMQIEGQLRAWGEALFAARH